MSAIFISHPLIQLTHVIYPLSCSSRMVRCMLCIFICFGGIKFKGSCRFIYSEGLLLVLEDRYITRHNSLWMNYHNLKFSILRSLHTAPTGYKRVWCLEWVHIINGAGLLIGGWQKLRVLYTTGRQRLNGWLFELNGVQDTCTLQVHLE